MSRNREAIYRDWKPTDENVRFVAEDTTAYPVMRTLAREVLALRDAVRVRDAAADALAEVNAKSIARRAVGAPAGGGAEGKAP